MIKLIIISALIIFLASIVQGALGFGFSLISVPLLAFILPIKEIVPIVVMASLCNNALVVYSSRKHMHISQIWIMIMFGIIGIPIGIYGLQMINPEVLKGIVGVVICITSLVMIKGYKIRFKRQKLSYAVSGLLSGILNGSLSMSGPPIVLFLSNEGYGKDEFRANLALNAIITNAITVLLFVINDMITGEMVRLIGLDIVALLIGSVIGILGVRQLKEHHFRGIVLGLITVIGFITVIKVFI